MEQLPWQDRLQQLDLEPGTVARAVAGRAGFAGDWLQVFDPFVGHWFGSDLHDASRAYQHVWHPGVCHGDLLAQPVVMVPSGTQATRPDDSAAVIMAYNFASLQGPRMELTGVVGELPQVGFVAGNGAILWFGEQDDGWVSAHLERVRARGQLYDIRGWVYRPGPDGPEQALPSDWRYHRVAPGAIQAPEL